MGMPTEHRQMWPRWLKLLVVAAASWVGGCVITVVEFAVFGHGVEAVRQAARDLFVLPALAVPAAVYAACLGVDVFLRRGLTLASEYQRWMAGGWFAAATVLTAATIGVVWGGTYSAFYLLFWSIFSGYAVLVFLLGALVWRPATDLAGLLD